MASNDNSNASPSGAATASSAAPPAAAGSTTTTSGRTNLPPATPVVPTHPAPHPYYPYGAHHAPHGSYPGAYPYSPYATPPEHSAAAGRTSTTASSGGGDETQAPQPPTSSQAGSNGEPGSTPYSETATPPRHHGGPATSSSSSSSPYGSTGGGGTADHPQPWPHPAYHGMSPYHHPHHAPPPPPRGGDPRHPQQQHHHLPPPPAYPHPWSYPIHHPPPPPPPSHAGGGSPAAPSSSAGEGEAAAAAAAGTTTNHRPPPLPPPAPHPHHHYYGHMYPYPHLPHVPPAPMGTQQGASATGATAAAATAASYAVHRSPLPGAAAGGGGAPASGRRGAKNKRDELREAATSPTQLHSTLRDEIHNMGCTCKRTRCLKLYCQCFAAKLYCGGQCRCLLCCNLPRCERIRKDAQRAVLARNPNAFDTKYRRMTDEATGSSKAADGVSSSSTNRGVGGASGQGHTAPTAVAPAPAATKPAAIGPYVGHLLLGTATQAQDSASKLLAHKTGCRCKKSNCMKKYCECYAGFVKCTANCRCVGCKNMGIGVDEEKNPDPDDPFMSMKVARKRPGQSPHGQSLQPIAPALPPGPPHPGYAHPHPHHHHPLPHPYYMHPMHHPMHPHLAPHPVDVHAYSSPLPAMTAATPPSSSAGRPRHASSKGETQSAETTLTGGEGTGEPWLAAQNLTFLKRGSPPSENKPKLDPSSATGSGAHHHEEIVSMPSLAESSQGTEPTSNSHEEASTAEPGVDSLLMAAMAMTEFAKT